MRSDGGGVVIFGRCRQHLLVHPFPKTQVLIGICMTVTVGTKAETSFHIHCHETV